MRVGVARPVDRVDAEPVDARAGRGSAAVRRRGLNGRRSSRQRKAEPGSLELKAKATLRRRWLLRDDVRGAAVEACRAVGVRSRAAVAKSTLRRPGSGRAASPAAGSCSGRVLPRPRIRPGPGLRSSRSGCRSAPCPSLRRSRSPPSVSPELARIESLPASGVVGVAAEPAEQLVWAARRRPACRPGWCPRCPRLPASVVSRRRRRSLGCPAGANQAGATAAPCRSRPRFGEIRPVGVVAVRRPRRAGRLRRPCRR